MKTLDSGFGGLGIACPAHSCLGWRTNGSGLRERGRKGVVVIHPPGPDSTAVSTPALRGHETTPTPLAAVPGLVQ